RNRRPLVLLAVGVGDHHVDHVGPPNVAHVALERLRRVVLRDDVTGLVMTEHPRRLALGRVIQHHSPVSRNDPSHRYALLPRAARTSARSSSASRNRWRM